jgi:hypothetical protein
MKMILRISPSKQRAWRMLEHIYGQGDYAPERDITNRLGIGAFQLEAGYPLRDASTMPACSWPGITAKARKRDT